MYRTLRLGHRLLRQSRQAEQETRCHLRNHDVTQVRETMTSPVTSQNNTIRLLLPADRQ